jgi:hypothetical protein
MIKIWLKLRGYKRQAGALMAIIPMLLQVASEQFGLSIPKEIYSLLNTIAILGTAIWGVGWADKFYCKIGEKGK